jgi:hypothetical protein
MRFSKKPLFHGPRVRLLRSAHSAAAQCPNELPSALEVREIRMVWSTAKDFQNRTCLN